MAVGCRHPGPAVHPAEGPEGGNQRMVWPADGNRLQEQQEGRRAHRLDSRRGIRLLLAADTPRRRGHPGRLDRPGSLASRLPIGPRTSVPRGIGRPVPHRTRRPTRHRRGFGRRQPRTGMGPATRQGRQHRLAFPLGRPARGRCFGHITKRRAQRFRPGRPEGICQLVSQWHVTYPSGLQPRAGRKPTVRLIGQGVPRKRSR